MKIRHVKVSAGRTFNHPHEQYSNLRSDAILEADIDEGEDAIGCAKALQAKVEELAEDHKQHLLRTIEELYELGERTAEMRGLQKQLTAAQLRLDEIRGKHPELGRELPYPESIAEDVASGRRAP